MYRKILLRHFFAREFWGAVFWRRVAPHTGRGEWSQHYMCCKPVYYLLAFFFLGDAREFVLMYTRVHTCACVCCIVTSQISPWLADFLNPYPFFCPCFVLRRSQVGSIEKSTDQNIFSKRPVTPGLCFWFVHQPLCLLCVRLALGVCHWC